MASPKTSDGVASARQFIEDVKAIYRQFGIRVADERVCNDAIREAVAAFAWVGRSNG